LTEYYLHLLLTHGTSLDTSSSAEAGIAPGTSGVLTTEEVPDWTQSPDSRTPVDRIYDGMEAMVTNYPQRLTAVGHERTGTALVARTVTRLGQFLCGFRGHETMLHREGKRMMMRCSSCGYDTPGVEISEREPRRRFEGDAGRHHLTASPRLVLRKTA